MIFKENSLSKTAILLFAFSDDLQRSVKPLSKFKIKNELLWKNISNQKLNLLKKTKLPFFIANENQQIGNSFGQKLNHSVQNVFNQGFDKVIIIGNDCLSLTKKDLLTANDLLQENNGVLGKDFRKGAYLIGVTKENFDLNSFQNLQWQSKNIFTDLLSFLGGTNIGYLGPKNDFNNAFDFLESVKKLPFYDSFKKLYFKLLEYLPLQICYLKVTILTLKIYFHFNKGPPLLNYL